MEKISTNSYTGTRDFYPQDMRFREHMFSLIEQAIKKCAFEKISAPLLENFQIYVAKSGEEIAEKQLYVFTDKGNRKVAIRPEFTPTIARMFAAQIDKLAPIQRWYSIENFMRYERPQKGRLREFYQVNVDLIGAHDISADFEVLRTAQKIFEIFGATTDMYEIRINHRTLLNDILVEYIGLDEKKVLYVAKIIDKKEKVSSEIFEKMLEEIGITQEQIHKLILVFEQDFEQIFELIPHSKGAQELKEILDLGKQVFQEKNPLKYDFGIVRGLAYYTGLVFEAYDKNSNNSRALFGGGRYDNLIELFHKNQKISGVGFAIGDVTFETFLREHHLIADLQIEKHMIAVDPKIPLALFYTILENLQNMEEIFWESITMLKNLDFSKQDQLVKGVLNILTKNPFFCQNIPIENLLNNNKYYSIEIYANYGTSLKKQMQYANKSKIFFVWICGEPEMKRGIIKRKDMQTGAELEFDLRTFELIDSSS